MIGQTILSKVVTTLGMIVLAWLLENREFGAVSLAYAVSAFAGFFQAAGVRDVLVQRHARFGRWATAGFWMSLAVSGTAAALMLGAAPIASRLFESPELPGLIALLALRCVFDGLSVVPLARLHVDLRFRFIAALALCTTTGAMVLSIIMAWMGFGAYSFIAPTAVMAGAQTVLLWSLVHPRVGRSPQIRRWRYMLGDSSFLWGVGLLMVVITQGDRLVLGLFHSDKVVGDYFFAFVLSVQVVQLLGSNLGVALFPALSHLQHDPNRQAAAFVRASRVLGLVLIPACLLQSTLAGPGIRLLLDDKWLPIIPACSVLSLAMAFVAISTPTVSLFKAQARFKLFFWFNAAGAAAMMALVLIAAASSRAENAAFSVAVAILIHYIIFGPLGTYLGLRGRGVRRRHIAELYLVPAGAAALGLAPGLLICLWLPPTVAGDLAAIALTTSLMAVIYVPIIRRMQPGAVQEMVAQARLFLGRSRISAGTVSS